MANIIPNLLNLFVLIYSYNVFHSHCPVHVGWTRAVGLLYIVSPES